jgi:rod shape-determining protein MreC
MQRLLHFLYEYRAFFTFLILQLLCVWMIVQNNQYQGAQFFNTSNRVAAGVSGTTQDVKNYFALRRINDELSEENKSLRQKLEQREQAIQYLTLKRDSVFDTDIVERFEFVNAKVVNNSTARFKNFITINRGAEEGVEPGMAVINDNRAVGKVKAVSEQSSVLIKRTGHFGTVQWDGTDPRFIDLKYIPRHVVPLVGDSIVTSDFNAVFPPNVFVGIIRQTRLSESDQFHEIDVELAQDFGKLAYVQVVKSRLKREKDSLENIIIGEPK